MKEDWKRNLTLNERLYEIGRKLNPPFAMQFVIEGNQLIDPALFQSGLDQLAMVYPMLLLRRKGNYWNLTGEKAKVKVHKGSIPSDFESSIYRSKLDAEKGHCFEFNLFQTNTTTVLVRVLHSAMDGIGALHLMYGLFSILNGEELEKIEIHPTEDDLREELAVKVPKNGGGFTNKWEGLAVKNQTGNTDFLTDLVRLSASVNNSVGKIANWYVERTKTPAQFLIPVNCRRHGVFTKALSNLSLPIYLHVQPTQSATEIQADLLAKLASNTELGKDPLEHLAKFTPSALLKKGIKSKAEKAHKSNKYAMSGYISDLGFVDLEKLSFGSFKAIDFYSIPVYTSTIPICFLTLHHQGGTRICFSASSKYDVHEIKASLEEELMPSVNRSSETNKSKDSTQAISPLEVEIINVWKKFTIQDLNEQHLDMNYSDLGGESLSLLFIVEEIGKKHCSSNQGEFLEEVLKLSSHITIRKMAEILRKI